MLGNRSAHKLNKSQGNWDWTFNPIELYNHWCLSNVGILSFIIAIFIYLLLLIEDFNCILQTFYHFMHHLLLLYTTTKKTFQSVHVKTKTYFSYRRQSFHFTVIFKSIRFSFLKLIESFFFFVHGWFFHQSYFLIFIIIYFKQLF